MVSDLRLLFRKVSVKVGLVDQFRVTSHKKIAANASRDKLREAFILIDRGTRLYSHPIHISFYIYLFFFLLEFIYYFCIIYSPGKFPLI